MDQFIGWLLGLKNVTSIEVGRPRLSAAWALEHPLWLFAGVVLGIALALVYYFRYQPRGPFGWRVGLGITRALLLILLLVTLAVPVLPLVETSVQKPYLYLVFDGTDSMAIEDEWTDEEQAALTKAVGWKQEEGSQAPKSRLDYVKALLASKENNLLAELQESKPCRIESFIFDGNTTSRLRKLAKSEGDKIDSAALAQQLTSQGQVTAVGNVLHDVSQQLGSGNLAGVVVVSDFANNSGIPPIGLRGDGALSPTQRINAPVYTVGIGAVQVMDLAVDLQTDPKMKKAEKTNVIVKLRQTGLQDRTAEIRLTARKLGGGLAGGPGQEIPVGTKTATLRSTVDSIEFPFTPEESGQFEFIAEVTPLDGEIVDQNNRAVREVNIIDDYLRLMYVAAEPEWEWRFVKEVFHRDKLVGMEGFRTYLGSSDPRVRESNVLFLSTLTPKRSEFFANDVIFLGDMPQTALSSRFCDMTKEFVTEFGGGLVVIAGPRFGPAELAGTPLADILPVILEPSARLRDNQEFRLMRTPHADRYAFMRLGETDVENEKAWDNLGPLPWYQPVARLQERSTALAVHPVDASANGEPTPLIAIREFPSGGQVVYVGFNEFWRLRRKYGERYYREFWSKLIYRLGMSHALGSEKRFVVRTDRQQYRAEERVTLTIEAFDENFEPLTEEELPDRALAAELVLPGQGTSGPQQRTIMAPQLRPGVFEARIPVYAEGEYSMRIQDPITKEFKEVRFDVVGLSAERRKAVRDVQLQHELARETSGRAYELNEVHQLIDDLEVQPVTETFTRSHPLWSTPLWFMLLVGLMLSEWVMRKLVRLT